MSLTVIMAHPQLALGLALQFNVNTFKLHHCITMNNTNYYKAEITKVTRTNQSHTVHGRYQFSLQPSS